MKFVILFPMRAVLKVTDDFQERAYDPFQAGRMDTPSQGQRLHNVNVRISGVARGIPVNDDDLSTAVGREKIQAKDREDFRILILWLLLMQNAQDRLLKQAYMLLRIIEKRVNQRILSLQLALPLASLTSSANDVQAIQDELNDLTYTKETLLPHYRDQLDNIGPHNAPDALRDVSRELTDLSYDLDHLGYDDEEAEPAPQANITNLLNIETPASDYEYN